MNKIGEHIATLRKQRDWSQTQLARAVEASREAIGKYERGEATPSVETAKRIADALEVTLDYLVDEAAPAAFDRQTVNRIQALQTLQPEEQNHLFAIIDAYIRDAKTRQAYAS